PRAQDSWLDQSARAPGRFARMSPRSSPPRCLGPGRCERSSHRPRLGAVGRVLRKLRYRPTGIAQAAPFFFSTISYLSSMERVTYFCNPPRRHRDRKAFGGNREELAAKSSPLFLRSEEHTSELQSHLNLVCRLLLEKKKNNN